MPVYIGNTGDESKRVVDWYVGDSGDVPKRVLGAWRGDTGSQPRQFYGAGVIYALNRERRSVGVFDSSGRLVRTIRIAYSSALYTPTGLAVGGDRIFVAMDRAGGNNMIFVYALGDGARLEDQEPGVYHAPNARDISAGLDIRGDILYLLSFDPLSVRQFRISTNALVHLSNRHIVLSTSNTNPHRGIAVTENRFYLIDNRLNDVASWSHSGTRHSGEDISLNVPGAETHRGLSELDGVLYVLQTFPQLGLVRRWTTAGVGLEDIQLDVDDGDGFEALAVVP